jgi:hypothetical protein
LEIFDPVLYSRAENNFLLSTLGQPPVVALQSLPPNVNIKAVKPVLDRVFELQQLQEHSNQSWVGVEAVKAKIQTYLEQSAKWAAEKRRGRPRYPSMFSFDQRGKAHRSGPGSDSGRVRTYFNEKGERIPFAIDLTNATEQVWAPDWIAVAANDEPKAGLKVDSDKRRIECLICGHTESFNTESRASFNAARARISRHLRSAKTQPEAHREVHTAEFGA